MTASRNVQSMGWTSRNVGVSVLLAMEEHRRAAGRRLAQIRDAAGLNQEELAHRAGLSTKTISRFETGRHDGRRDTVRRIAKALGVSVDDIIGEPPAPLGLSSEPNQLDRIEAKLDRLLELLDPDIAGAVAEAIVNELESRGAADPPAAAAPAGGSRRRSGGTAGAPAARAPRTRKA